MSKDLPFVSIGISFFNAEKSLLNAVRSVFIQTHKNWELILLDDGSTDESLNIAKSIDDPRVRVYSDGKNKKLAARLNQIITLSKYDFIARMDADDLMAPDRIEKQLKVLLENKDIDLVSTGVLSLNDDNEPVGIRCVEKEHSITAKNLLYGQSGIVHASVIARKSWYKRNFYREDYPIAEDKELWVRAYSNSDLKIAFIDQPLYFYREDGSISKDKLFLAYKQSRKVTIESAKQNFPFFLRVNTYLILCFKTTLSLLLTVFGRLDLLRKRRVKEKLYSAQHNKYTVMINKITNLNLPVKIDK